MVRPCCIGRRGGVELAVLELATIHLGVRLRGRRAFYRLGGTTSSREAAQAHHKGMVMSAEDVFTPDPNPHHPQRCSRCKAPTTLQTGLWFAHYRMPSDQFAIQQLLCLECFVANNVSPKNQSDSAGEGEE